MARLLIVVSLLLFPSTLSLPAIAQDILRGHGGPVRALAVRSDVPELISGSFDAAVIVWDLERNAARRVLRFHDGAVNAVAVLTERCLASAGEDKRIAIWCGEDARPARVLDGHAAPVTSLAPLDGGRRLASGSFDGTVRLWDAANGRLERTIAEHKGPVTALVVTADGSAIVSAGADGALIRTELAASAGATRLGLMGPVTALGSTPDGSIVAASSDGLVRIVSPALAVVAEIEVDTIPLASLAVSRDGRLIATAGLRGGIAVIEVAGHRIVHRLTGPGLPVWSLAFDADNRTLLSGGADRVVRRWDAATGKALSSTFPERDVVAEAVAGGERGAAVFRACQACHTLGPDGGNRAGPTLSGIFGRRVGTAPGYVYSDGFAMLDIVWSRETIARLFEVGPAAYTPGTKMPEQTITNPADRQALVDWLERITVTARH